MDYDSINEIHETGSNDLFCKKPPILDVVNTEKQSCDNIPNFNTISDSLLVNEPACNGNQIADSGPGKDLKYKSNNDVTPKGSDENINCSSNKTISYEDPRKKNVDDSLCSYTESILNSLLTCSSKFDEKANAGLKSNLGSQEKCFQVSAINNSMVAPKTNRDLESIRSFNNNFVESNKTGHAAVRDKIYSEVSKKTTNTELDFSSELIIENCAENISQKVVSTIPETLIPTSQVNKPALDCYIDNSKIEKKVETNAANELNGDAHESIVPVDFEKNENCNAVVSSERNVPNSCIYRENDASMRNAVRMDGKNVNSFELCSDNIPEKLEDHTYHQFLVISDKRSDVEEPVSKIQSKSINDESNQSKSCFVDEKIHCNKSGSILDSTDTVQCMKTTNRNHYDSGNCADGRDSSVVSVDSAETVTNESDQNCAAIRNRNLSKTEKSALYTSSSSTNSMETEAKTHSNAIHIELEKEINCRTFTEKEAFFLNKDEFIKEEQNVPIYKDQSVIMNDPLTCLQDQSIVAIKGDDVDMKNLVAPAEKNQNIVAKKDLNILTGDSDIIRKDLDTLAEEIENTDMRKVQDVIVNKDIIMKENNDACGQDVIVNKDIILQENNDACVKDQSVIIEKDQDISEEDKESIMKEDQDIVLKKDQDTTEKNGERIMRMDQVIIMKEAQNVPTKDGKILAIKNNQAILVEENENLMLNKNGNIPPVKSFNSLTDEVSEHISLNGDVTKVPKEEMYEKCLELTFDVKTAQKQSVSEDEALKLNNCSINAKPKKCCGTKSMRLDDIENNNLQPEKVEVSESSEEIFKGSKGNKNVPRKINSFAKVNKVITKDDAFEASSLTEEKAADKSSSSLPSPPLSDQSTCSDVSYDCKECGAKLKTQNSLFTHKKMHLSESAMSVTNKKRKSGKLEEMKEEIIKPKRGRKKKLIVEKLKNLVSTVKENVVKKIMRKRKAKVEETVRDSVKRAKTVKEIKISKTEKLVKSRKTVKAKEIPKTKITKAVQKKNSTDGENKVTVSVDSTNKNSSKTESVRQKMRKKSSYSLPSAINIRKFVCPECGAKFKRNDHLKRHQLLHAEKSFECSDCGLKFHRGDKLKLHCVRHHSKVQKKDVKTVSKVTKLPKKSVECHKCGFQFLRISPPKTEARPGPCRRKNSCCISCGTKLKDESN